MIVVAFGDELEKIINVKKDMLSVTEKDDDVATDLLVDDIKESFQTVSEYFEKMSFIKFV